MGEKLVTHVLAQRSRVPRDLTNCILLSTGGKQVIRKNLERSSVLVQGAGLHQMEKILEVLEAAREVQIHHFRALSCCARSAERLLGLHK